MANIEESLEALKRVFWRANHILEGDVVVRV
jgi:hypothetical protein